MPDNFQEKDQGRHTFLALTGSEVTAYDTDRTAFLGTYRTYSNPVAVEQGQATNSLASGDNAVESSKPASASSQARPVSSWSSWESAAPPKKAAAPPLNSPTSAKSTKN